MNARYHSAREAFLDTVHRWFMLGVIVFGAAAVIKLFPQQHWVEAVLSALAALLAALDLTFDLSNRARAHSLMKRRYFELLADLDEEKKTIAEALACLNKFSADEEPVYNALLMLCWNAAQESVHGDDAEAKIIPWVHRCVKNMLRLAGSNYPMKPRQTAA